MKKCILAWVLSISLSLTVFTGCGKEEVSENPAERAGGTTSDTGKNGQEDQEKKKAAEKEQKTEPEEEQRFHGSYEGNDGCRYEFTKDGTLTVTFDGAVFEYQYTLQENMLTIMEEDGTEEGQLKVTMLENGTYLLEDNSNGTQIVLTYLQ